MAKGISVLLWPRIKYALSTAPKTPFVSISLLKTLLVSFLFLFP